MNLNACKAIVKSMNVNCNHLYADASMIANMLMRDGYPYPACILPVQVCIYGNVPKYQCVHFNNLTLMCCLEHKCEVQIPILSISFNIISCK